MNKNIIWYINEYGDKSFDEFSLNEVDALVFSQLAYNNFKVVLNNFDDQIILSSVYDKLIETNKEKNGISKDNGLSVLKAIKNKKRYSNIIFKYFKYVIGSDYQFGAISVIIPNNYIYINFEGTDATIPGWKEDFYFSFTYPTKSQSLAGKYVNKVLNKCNLPCIITGHSKGGNLALVGAMNTNILKKHRIHKVYSFDGPGLREKEFNSLKYKSIKDKLINIIPEQSLFGVLLNQENIVAIKSNATGIMQHSALTWRIDEDKLLRGKQSTLSINLSKAIDEWLIKYNNKEREIIIKSIFSLFEENDIKTLPELNKNKLKILGIIKSSFMMSKETKLVLLNCIQLLVGEITSQLVSENKKKIYYTIDKIKSELINID